MESSANSAERAWTFPDLDSKIINLAAGPFATSWRISPTTQIEHKVIDLSHISTKRVISMHRGLSILRFATC